MMTDDKQTILFYDKNQQCCFLSEEAAKHYKWTLDVPVAVFSCENEINIRPLVNDESILYHYCSFSTFLSIIENKCLWLTDPLASNDSEELIWATKQLDSLFIEYNDLIENANENKFEEIIAIEKHGYVSIFPDFEDSLEKGLNSLFNNKSLEERKYILLKGIGNFRTVLYKELRSRLRATYISCFSLCEDKLSQWRGYGEDGAGVAIGIKVKTIKEYEKNVKGIFARQVEYYEANQKNILQKGLAEWMKDLNSIKQWTHSVFPFIKPVGFREEEEWRLIYNPEKENELKFNCHKKGNRLGWHYELPITPDTISKIIIGPKNKTKPGEIAKVMAMNGFQIQESQIEPSKLTYR